jgi:ADP-ribose pyrophosphatase YjhB (NUDIX family)
MEGRLGRLMQAVYWLARVYWRVCKPRTVGVRAIVTDGQGVLLVRHSYRAGWFLPGGGVKRGEPLVAAIRRELREEVGIAGVPDEGIQLVGAYSNLREGKSDHVVVVAVRKWTEFHPRPNREIRALEFFPFQRLPQGTSPATTRRIGEYLAGTSSVANW